MATSSFYKFQIFVQDIGSELHTLGSDNLFILLANVVPNAADTHVDTTTGTCEVHATGSCVEIAAASGYTKKGFQLTSVTWAQTSGTAKLYAAVASWTAAATIGPFRYAVLYNDSGGTTSTRPVIGWFDFSNSITLYSGDTYTIGNSNDGTAWTATFPILTIA